MNPVSELARCDYKLTFNRWTHRTYVLYCIYIYVRTVCPVPVHTVHVHCTYSFWNALKTNLYIKYRFKWLRNLFFIFFLVYFEWKEFQIPKEFFFHTISKKFVEGRVLSIETRLKNSRLYHNQHDIVINSFRTLHNMVSIFGRFRVQTLY